MRRLPWRLALISHAVPPAISGTAIRLRRLFSGIDPADYCIMSSRQVAEAGGEAGRLPVRYHQLPAEWRRIRGFWRGASHEPQWLNLFFKLGQRARNLTRLLREERCSAALAVSGDLLDLPAAYLASRWCRIPFFAEVDDDYRYQWIDYRSRLFARWVEPRVLKGARSVIVLNEFMHDEYKRRYGIQSAVVYNPCSGPPRASLPWPSTDRPLRIVYTGSVFHLFQDAIENVVTALEMARTIGLAAQLHIYTSQSRAEVEKAFPSPTVVFGGCVSPDTEAPAVQSDSDVLLLPLGFRTPVPEVVRTTQSFKITDYLVSGRPILVHAPADSYAAWYFRRNECGLVVDAPDPRLVLDALRRLAGDAVMREHLIGNAARCAATDFSLGSVQARFIEALQ